MLILNKQRKAEKLIESLPFLPQQAEQVIFLIQAKRLNSKFYS